MPSTISTAARLDYLRTHGILPRQAEGLLQLRHARDNGMLVGVYDALAAGIEDDPELRWATVCEHHGAVVCHPTRGLALRHAADPRGWCEPCRERSNR